jgi:uncharacterized protein (DUF305 family)
MATPTAARDSQGAMVRRRLGCWVVIAVLAAGCATPDDANQPPADDRTDVWFMQHMAPHLLQDSSIAYLTRDRISDPELARLADTVHRSGQAHLGRLQGWLAERGLAPHGHSHQRGDTLRRTDLERLSRLDGHALDLTFVKVMTARHRAGSKLAATQLRDGSLPEVRQLAQQLLAEHQAQIATMTAWKRAWSKARPNHPITKPSAINHGTPGGNPRWLAATAGGDGVETVRALLDKQAGSPWTNTWVTRFWKPAASTMK